MKITILLITTTFFLYLDFFGQEKIKTDDEFNYSISPGSVVETYFESENSNYLVDIISENGSKIYLNGQFIANLNTEEKVIGMEGDQLYIAKFFIEKNYKEISTYKLNQHSISKLQSKVINHLEVNARFIDKRLVVSDDIEGFGTIIEFFDANLNSIISYYPFEEGYYSAEISIKNNIATVFSNPLGNGKVSKMARFNLNTKQLLFEKDITIPNTLVKKIYTVNDGLIVYCSTEDNQRKIMKFDNDGNVGWSKNQLLPMFNKDLGIFESIIDSKLYIITEKTVIDFCDSKSGKLLKKIDLNDLNRTPLNSNHTISSFVIKSTGEIIIISGDLDWDKVDPNSFVYKNNKLYNINLKENNYSVIELDTDFKRPRISFSNDSIVIKSEKKKKIIASDLFRNKLDL